mgnify:CR=1 FL=1
MGISHCLQVPLTPQLLLIQQKTVIAIQGCFQTFASALVHVKVPNVQVDLVDAVGF